MTEFSLIAWLLLILSVAPAHAGDKLNEDPNAAARKAVNPLGSSALADVERVQKTNSQLAVDHFTKLIQKDPKEASSYAYRGKAYAGLRQYDKALEDYEKAIELDPKQTQAYIGRAVVRYTEKDYDGSWEDVHKAESLGGEFWPSFLEALKASSGRTE